MRKLTIIIALSFALLSLAIYDVEALKTESGFQFSLHEMKGTDYTYPAFKFAVKMPDGSIVGWNKNTNLWTGNISKSEVTKESFDYPFPGNECTSNDPAVLREMFPSPDLEIEYTTTNALHCKNLQTGENSFIGSGYGVIIGGSSDAKYEIIIYPEKHAIVNGCFGYTIEGEEPHNSLCTDYDFIKFITIIPGVEQTLEFNYNYTSASANKVEKVVTSATLVGSWESCYKMGMIKNFGLYNSVKQKLDNAAKQQAKGQLDAAANIRNAALNEIEAQHGKGIDKMCGGIMILDLKADVR